jgi:hypothetical protein
MADVERIAPPVPTLPAPVGRSVGDGRRQRPPREPAPEPKPADDEARRDRLPEHIDEYV